MKEIRKLRADEIELRVGATTRFGKGMLLLYKDARCDMALLDETFGIGNWQSEYLEIKGVLFCKVGVRASSTAQGNEQPLPVDSWVWKTSNGVESQGTGDDDPNNVKGEASDAFKRACFMWGIGRELYDWKGIWINHDKEKDKYEKYYIEEISYDGDSPSKLIIVNSKGETVYSFNAKAKKPSYQKKPVEQFENTTPSIDTKKEEKPHTSENNTVKNDFKDNKPLAKTKENENVDLDNEKLLKLIATSNREIFTEMNKIVYAYGQENGATEDEIKEAVKIGGVDYLTKALKISLKQIELSLIERKPHIVGNTVIVFDDSFKDAFKKYLNQEVYMPF